ncbi:MULTISPECIES: DMT family transporter [Bacillus]|uniref:EamA/RhaT family transporter n=2 Tax=Bacillus cereus group TaxID=86661 RepID=A0A2A7D9R0_BACAN|nr:MULTISPECIES: DMT family transporter [Bacillus]MCP1163775.1 DMT family transporter [Bacillus sp. 1813sda1]MDC7975315.1 DMT family transporter [Bacillus sp. BLCC-B18]OTW72596.1 EamA family transporter [Bacillus thuringiensis serovar coreanensis]OTX49652.1 EamA family transporter [Bacillus thuringiensis serovar sooncheon]OTX57171.1 EamA family transporter [Bacillus thuringiensis serovar guiyangiensis]
MKLTTKAYLSALLYSLIIGFSFMFVKLALTVTSPLDTLAHRFTVAFVAASIPIVFGFVKLNMSFKNILALLPLAIFYPALFFAFQAFGLVYTSSSEAGIIQAAIPIFTMMLASYFLKEYTNTWQKISVLISVIGVIYIFIMNGIETHETSFIGVILILLSALSSAFYNVLARKMTKKFKLMDLTYTMTVIGFISFNLIAIASHISKGTITAYFQPFTNGTFVISILYLGLLSSLLTALLLNYSLSYIEAAKISVFSNLSTLITIIAGVIFLHEQISYFHIIGTIMIIFGVIGTNFLGEKGIIVKKKNISMNK